MTALSLGVWFAPHPADEPGAAPSTPGHVGLSASAEPVERRLGPAMTDDATNAAPPPASGAAGASAPTASGSAAPARARPALQPTTARSAAQANAAASSPKPDAPSFATSTPALKVQQWD